MDAIKQSAEKIASDIPAGSRVAIVNFESASDNLSEFIIIELTGELRDLRIEVVERRTIEFVSRELDFQLSGFVSDETVQSIGKFTGAEFVIVGQLRHIGSVYRFTSTVIHVENATNATVPRFDVRNDRATRQMFAILNTQTSINNIARGGVSDQTRPQTAGTFLDRGIMFAMRGEFDMAIMDFTEAIRLNQDLASAFQLRGRALFSSVSNVTFILDNFSGVVTLSNNRVSAEQANVIDQSIRDFSQAIRLDPDNAENYIGRGRSYSSKEDHGAAIADYTQAIRLNPNSAEAFNNRGGVYYRMGDFDRAIADYNQAIRLAPNYVNAFINRGNVYADMGDFDRAIVDYNQAIRLNPNYASAFNNRGLVYERMGDYDRAIADYTQTIRLNPNFEDVFNNRGRVYRRMGDFDRAIADYNQAIRLAPNYVNAFISRGNVYADMGDFDRAILDYNQAIRLNPNDALAFFNRGLIYRSMRDYDQAIADFEAALRIDPNHTRARQNLEIIRQQQGR